MKNTKKRLVAFLACGVLTAGAAMGLSACGDKDDNSLTVWGPNNQQTLLRELIDDFKTENPDFGLDIKLGVCGENEAYANMSKDVQASADVYGYANDQLINLRKAGAVARLSDSAVATIKENNDAGSVESGKITEKGVDAYFGYPYASDNGFFMYYDKSVVSEEQAKTLEGVLEACAAGGKYFLFNMNDQPSWYVGSFLYGAGGQYEAIYDGSVVSEVKCNFNEKKDGTNYTYGEIGGQGLIDLKNNKRYISCNDNVISTYLTGGKLGACVSGTWNAKAIKEKLGDNYAAAKLPTYHSSLTGEDYQIVPFMGYKLYGVNPYSKHVNEAHQLAAYLAGEKAQQKRFEALEIGPSNKTVAASEAVKSNVALAALLSQTSFAKVQTSLPGGYWSAFDAFGTGIYNGEITSANLKDKVGALVEGLGE